MAMWGLSACCCYRHSDEAPKVSDLLPLEESLHYGHPHDDSPATPRGVAESALPVDAFEKTRNQFQVKMEMEESGIGLDFDTTDPQVCAVVRIDPFGQAFRWNQATAEEIRVHDRLVAVNNVFLPAAELREKLEKQCASSSLELSFERPHIYTFNFDRADDKVGLSLTTSKSSPCLVLRELDPQGVVMRSKVRHGDTRPKEHDRIIQVNGEQFNPTRMAKLLSAKKVTLTACRYSVWGCHMDSASQESSHPFCSPCDFACALRCKLARSHSFSILRTIGPMYSYPMLYQRCTVDWLLFHPFSIASQLSKLYTADVARYLDAFGIRRWSQIGMNP